MRAGFGYRGRVVAVPETGGPVRVFTVDAAPGESQGAVWMGGAAPVVDDSGHIWITTGNGSVYSDKDAYDDGLLLAACAENVVAYAAPASGAATTPGAGQARPTACQAYSAPAAPKHLRRRDIAAIALGALVVIAGLGWLGWLRWRKKSGHQKINAREPG